LLDGAASVFSGSRYGDFVQLSIRIDDHCAVRSLYAVQYVTLTFAQSNTPSETRGRTCENGGRIGGGQESLFFTFFSHNVVQY